MLRIEEIVGAMDDEFRYALDALSDERLATLAADKSALRRLRPVGVSNAEALEMIAAIQARRAEQRRKAEDAERRKAARAARRKASPRRRKPAQTAPSESHSNAIALPNPPAPLPETVFPAALPPPPLPGRLPAPAASVPAIRLPPPATNTPAIMLPPPADHPPERGEEKTATVEIILPQPGPSPRSRFRGAALWGAVLAVLVGLVLAIR